MARINNSSRRLSALPQHGNMLHIIADAEIGDKNVQVMTACGKLIDAAMILDVLYTSISCPRCRSVDRQYSHKIGRVE